MTGIEVVRTSGLARGDSTDGITRMKAFDRENAIVSQSRIAPKVVSGWHHHGTRDLYGVLVSGHLQLEYTQDGPKIADVQPGDFFHIPVGLVHRDVNPDSSEEATVSTILIGTGPAVVNVDPPAKRK
jgi:quercetin dioxygenase-like cupin family protein